MAKATGIQCELCHSACQHLFHFRGDLVCLNTARSYKERYAAYLQTEEWHALREHILELYDWKCADCGDDATEVHHLTYERVFHELPSDLVPLCRWHHKVRHDRIYLDLDAVVERAMSGTGRRYSREDLVK